MFLTRRVGCVCAVYGTVFRIVGSSVRYSPPGLTRLQSLHRKTWMLIVNEPAPSLLVSLSFSHTHTLFCFSFSLSLSSSCYSAHIILTYFGLVFFFIIVIRWRKLLPLMGYLSLTCQMFCLFILRYLRLFFFFFQTKNFFFLSLSLSLFYNLGSSIRTQTHKYPTPSPEAHDLLFFPMRGKERVHLFLCAPYQKANWQTKQNLVKLIMVSFVFCFFSVCLCVLHS